MSIKKLISKKLNARGWAKKHLYGGLVTTQNYGTIANGGKENELQSAIKSGLQWLGDRFVDAQNYMYKAEDFVEDGVTNLISYLPGGVYSKEEMLEANKRERTARRNGEEGYVGIDGKFHLFPITGVAPLPGVKKVNVSDWDDLYKQTLARTKITTTSPEKMYLYRRATDSSDRFLAGRQVTEALENSKDFAGYYAHGMAKGSDSEMLARLRTVLRHGTNPNKNFYTSTVGKIDPMARVHMGTASGHAYSDGPFMLLTKDPLNTARSGAFSHVLINNGMGDEALDLATKYKTVLLKEFPNVKFLLYNEVK